MFNGTARAAVACCSACSVACSCDVLLALVRSRLLEPRSEDTSAESASNDPSCDVCASCNSSLATVPACTWRSSSTVSSDVPCHDTLNPGKSASGRPSTVSSLADAALPALLGCSAVRCQGCHCANSCAALARWRANAPVKPRRVLTRRKRAHCAASCRRRLRLSQRCCALLPVYSAPLCGASRLRVTAVKSRRAQSKATLAAGAATSAPSAPAVTTEFTFAMRVISPVDCNAAALKFYSPATCALLDGGHTPERTCWWTRIPMVCTPLQRAASSVRKIPRHASCQCRRGRRACCRSRTCGPVPASSSASTCARALHTPPSQCAATGAMLALCVTQRCVDSQDGAMQNMPQAGGRPGTSRQRKNIRWTYSR